MKVLITGSTGQVGRALTASAPESIEVIATTRAELDIRDRDAVTDCVGRHLPDLIINAAAHTAVDQAESEPELARSINELGAQNLAISARLNTCRMIQLSTDFVFAGDAAEPYAPDTEPRPLSVYGSTKLAGEKAVLGELPGRSIVVRTAWVYSAVGNNFLLSMLRRMREREPVRVVSDQTGTPTAADSVAATVWALAVRPDIEGLYHWTDAGVASWYEFAVAIAEEATAIGLVNSLPDVVPIATEDYPTPARRPRFSVLDTHLTTTVTGIVPLHWRVRLRRVLGDLALD
jgi:dTDP-4-dehydrorhamnose reductase